MSMTLSFILRIASTYPLWHDMTSFLLFIPHWLPDMEVSFIPILPYLATIGGRGCPLLFAISLLVVPSANR